ncbi:MAG: succinate dehydrogenase assembly factor 2 [Pseudomonadales bacterium]|nr:succinate dehydrogenase assembly factor 2 [Pseudomonadales bacterium]
MTNKNEMGRLLWQCRRGMKEVEVFLLPYLERFYFDASEGEKTLFNKLLTCEDPDMFEWFVNRAVPEDNELAEIVGIVLQRLASRP